MDAKQFAAIILVVLAALTVFALAGAASAEVRYTVTEFSVPGEAGSEALAVNNSGQVLWYSWPSSGWDTDFLWDPTAGTRNLSELLTKDLGEYTDVWDLNDAGQFAVFGPSVDPRYVNAAYLWDGVGTPEYVGPFAAIALNNPGRICGYAMQAGEPQTIGMVWDRAGGLRQIDTLPGGDSITPQCINNLGQVAGIGTTDIGQDPYEHSPLGQHAFLWDDDLGTVDLGTLDCGDDVVYVRDVWGINDAGQVVGTALSEDGDERFYHAFLWTPGVGMRDLGVLPGDQDAQAYGINNSGQVIGVSKSKTSGRPFMWDAINGMQPIMDFLPPGTDWLGFCPEAINDTGEIVALCYVPSDPTPEWEWDWRYRAGVLTPIPECSTAGIVAWGLVALRGRRRRRWHHP